MHLPTKLSPNKTCLTIVAPVFNECDVVPLFIRRIDEIFSEHKDINLELLFVNDGSSDKTLEVLLELQRDDTRIIVLDLSRNFGKEAALSAGVDEASGDVVVPIDVDLQDPPELILVMLERWREGYEVVLARRIDRGSDHFLKRLTAQWFYRINNQISSHRLPENVGDYRLMDRKVIQALRQLPEANRFMKGLFSWVGYRTCCVDYVRQKRAAGKTKFNGMKLINLAIEGITSFSTYPLRIWSYIGLGVSTLSFLFAMFIVIRVLVLGIDMPGYASLMVAVTFLGGLQLIGIGVLGEYLGRTYLESKRRPVYILRQVYRGNQ